MFKQAKIRTIHGLLCQGRKEEFYINKVFESGKSLPIKAETIQTPLGRYTPDFEFPDRFIEIKGGGTFRVLLGEEAYIRGGKVSDLQWRKIQWVSQNMKPVEIIVIAKDEHQDVTIPNKPNQVKVTKYHHK